MKTILPLLFFGVVAGSCLLVGAAGKLPALTAERWVNSAPLTVAGLRGKVVLVDVWEYKRGYGRPSGRVGHCVGLCATKHRSR